MRTSEQGIELIKSFEGYSATAYKDCANVPTIGYGHTNGVRMGMETDEVQADLWLRDDIRFAENAVNAALPRLKQHQFDALVSFVFNLGTGAFKGSTLLLIAKVNPDDERIPREFRKWDKARINGTLQSLPALAKRRDAEARLYEHGNY